MIGFPRARWRIGGPPAGHGATVRAPHIRDPMSTAGAMNCVVVALLPCLFMALFNTGHQANLAMQALKVSSAPGWRGAVIDSLGIGYDPASILASMWLGALHYLPVLAVAAICGAFWEWLFAVRRGRARGPGLMVVALLFSLSLPPSVPLWQVALGMSFGIVVGREIFGGTGRNFLNPALVGLAFLYATWPTQMLGGASWTVVDGFTGATNLRAAAAGGVEAASWAGSNWMLSFLGVVPGSFGETSTLACLLGAAYLIYRRVASARIMMGALAGMIATALLFNWLIGGVVPFGDLSWHWHLTLGGFAFGVVFLATDPVTAASTRAGRWVYGALIGSLVVVLRVANIAHPDGVMYAILFGNMTAPLIDYAVVRANVRRRERRHAGG